MLGRKAQALIGLSFLVTLGLLSGCTKPEQKAEPRASETSRSQPPGLLEYIELTTAGSAADDTLPMVIAVHGLGDQPANFKNVLKDIKFPARIILPRAPIKWNVGFAWFLTRLASRDWDALGRGIWASAKQVADLIAHLGKKLPTKGSPVLWGFSQGGMISFAVAVNHPETIGLSIPIGGMLPKQSWPKAKQGNIKYPPIRALHGDADTLVPIQMSRDTVEHLAGLGFDASLQSYRGVPHAISPQMHRELVNLIFNVTN